MFHGRDPAFVTTAAVDSYLNLQPATVVPTGGGAKGATVAIAAAAVVVAAVAAIVLVRAAACA